ncbi:MAG: hypothetical protein IJV05_11065 [Muribaculaceae bacterium]|nr:hypothetical protein [Muribaculaceae bacterium]
MIQRITQQFIILTSVLFLALTASAQTCDPSGDCGGDETQGTYDVLSPMGQSAVDMIEMAPRLETLDGKTIALVGGSFMASVTHVELKKLILDAFPTAKVYVLSEIGSAGLFPGPRARKPQVERFQQRLLEYGVDAVISGNGGCGICTPKETGSCIAAEYIGIPSVMIAAPGFDTQAKTTAYNNGLPVLRVAVYPGAFASHTEEQLKENTREVLWPQILDMLTEPITQEEIDENSHPEAADPQEAVFSGTIDEVNEFFRDMMWSDGMPIIPPTKARVEEFMKYTDYRWNRTIAVLSPSYRQSLVWHVAVNGVMAGCKPEYMPLLIALTKAMTSGDFRRTLGSTHAWVPYCWANGPVARQLGLDHSQGQINEQANVAIGRFLNLAMLNLAGYYVKQDRMGTFGYPVSWCMAEDDAACLRIGWNPYHVRQGIDLNQSAITAASTLLWGNNMPPATTDGEKIMQLLAWDITERCQLALGSGVQFTNRTILMTEEVAAHLKEVYGTVDNLEDQLIATARRPLYERTYAHYYANPGSAINPDHTSLQEYMEQLREEENAEMTPTPEWYASDEPMMLTIPTMVKGETAFIITGDASRNKIQTMPGGGRSTVEVELPANWDELMAEKGYEPLRSFYLEPINDEGQDHMTDIEEVEAAPAQLVKDTSVRYYNLNGHESGRPFDGVNIEVTTHSDNTRSAKKYIRVH